MVPVVDVIGVVVAANVVVVGADTDADADADADADVDADAGRKVPGVMMMVVVLFALP